MRKMTSTRGGRALLAAAFALSTVWLTGLTTDPAIAQAQREIITHEASDIPGGDYATLRDVDLDVCRQACLDDNFCAAFTYNAAAGWCFLKDRMGELQPYADAISGEVVTRTVDVSPRRIDWSDLSLLPPGFLDQAIQFHGQVVAAARGEDDLFTPEDARVYLEAGSTYWTEAAHAWLDFAQTADGDMRWRLPRQAGYASYIAFLLAETANEEAAALSALGRAFSDQQVFRPALEAYKASLSRVNDPVVAGIYEDLRATEGFRLLDYTVESDATEPRICLVFSEQVDTGSRVNLADYITIDGATPQLVTATDAQVCVEGVRHGQRYEVAAREGLPSIVGEDLIETTQWAIYVRDRSASVRFTGRDYVLPSHGTAGVPLVSVNTELVHLELLRMGDRALAGEVAGGSFREQLAGYEIDEIVEERGSRVWSGSLDVERDLNRDVTTAFPISEVAGPLEPGVYILTARAEGQLLDRWDDQATQWFIVSDLGLSALSGEDGIHISVRSLATADPVSDATIEIVARNNDILANAVTDEDGTAVVAAGPLRGTGGDAPALAVVRFGDNDFAFLDLSVSGFDLSDRGVEGRLAPGALDVFVTPERGIYRPGETVHLTALVRTDTADAAPRLPLTVKILRPDGVEHANIVTEDQGAGGHALALDLSLTAQTGTWTVSAHADPDGRTIGETRFLVEDFVPERLDMTLEPNADRIGADQPVTLSVDGRYLYGAPAADLRLEGTVSLAIADTPVDGYPDYQFGLSDEAFETTRRSLAALPNTDASGDAEIEVTLDTVPETTRRLQADVAIRLVETSGRFIERNVTLPVATGRGMIGIRTPFGDTLNEGDIAQFDIILLDEDGARRGVAGLEWELVRLEDRFQWYRRDGQWRFERTTISERVANGLVEGNPDGPARIEEQVTWGRYRFEVRDPDVDGPATSVTFRAGWFVADSTAETPDELEIALDQESYDAGDIAQLSVSPRFAGRADIFVVSNRVLFKTTADVPLDGTTIDLPIAEVWGPGAYVLVSLNRGAGDTNQQLPGRAIGVAWMAVDQEAHTLDVAIEAPADIRSANGLTVPVRLEGLTPGSEAYVRIAAVDLGILNLTGFETPDPEAYFLGQRQLGVDIRDLYGSLIDATGVAAGRIRSGGDGGGALLQGEPPTQDLVADVSDILPVGPDGTVEASFLLPPFNGTVRVMALAWSDDRVGSAEADVIVRDPVVVTATVPRFLAPGDTAQASIDLHNVAAPDGTFGLTIESLGPVDIDTPGSSDLDLTSGERLTVTRALTATDAGRSEIDLSLTGVTGPPISQTLRLPVRHPSPPVTRERYVSLAPGESLTLDAGLLADLVANSVTVSVTAGPGAAFDIPGLLTALDRYPYGCAEQVTSQALPLLYLDAIAQATGVATDAEITRQINEAIARVLALQDGNGSFGLWFPGSGDPWLDAYVTDFLLRAREEGYTVAHGAMESALDGLQNYLRWNTDFSDGGETVAYALYALARAGRAAIGDLRYYADERMQDFATPLARAQIGAALALYGDRERASTAFQSASQRTAEIADHDAMRQDYGSALRDQAGVVALASAQAGGLSDVAPVLPRLDEHRQSRTRLSTQESAWLLLAANGLLDRSRAMILDVAGTEHRGALFQTYSASEVQAGVTIRNDGADPIPVALSVSGVPVTPEPPTSDGLEISRSYYLPDGTPVSPDEVAQNTRLVVVLDVTELEERRSRLLLIDMLPAGFEIDNPRLIDSAQTRAFDWLGDTGGLQHSEFRDDRFVAAFDRYDWSSRTMTVAYVVRAVTPGDYAHPAASVEDMYDAERIARTETGRVIVTPAQ